MSRPDGGILVPVADLTSEFESLKVRTVGFLTDYQVDTGKGQLESGKGKLCVDLNLVLQGAKMGEFPLQPKLMIIGTIEKEEASKMLTLLAICIIPVQDLDIKLWEQAARKLSQTSHNSVLSS